MIMLKESSKLYANFTGITPNEYKKMREDIHITYGFGHSTFGNAMIASTHKGICCLEFYDESYDNALNRLQKTWNNALFIQDNQQAQSLLDKIFINKQKMNLFVKGTNFQIKVWKALLNIQYGTLSTYSDIAKIIGKPKAVRAVATAIGSNHIGYLIPCHRVISKNGAFAGYKWGIARKQVILVYENQE